jgi:integrase
MLNRHRRAEGYILPAGNGQPLNLDNLARRVIAPALAVNQIPWHGWHAFRRGLATNLHRWGVDDKLIQAILRHASLSTTVNIYVKHVSADVQAAMDVLDSKLQPSPKLPN